MGERKNTERNIIKGFSDLLSKKAITKIKINEVLEETKISRSTFYNYFSSIEDLSEQSFLYLCDQLTMILSQDFSYGQDVSIQALQFMKDNDKLITNFIFYYPNIDARTNEFIRNVILSAEHVGLEEKLALVYDIPNPYALEHHVSIIQTIVFTWIKTGFKEPPEHVFQILKQLLKY